MSTTINPLDGATLLGEQAETKKPENNVEEPGQADPLLVEKIKYYLARQSASQSYNADMSKWILGSLIVVNGGPFVLIFKDAPGNALQLKSSAIYFVIGLALAVLCGFLAWVNTGWREAEAGREVQLLLGRSPSSKIEANITLDRVNTVVLVSYIASIAAGFGSLGMFVTGAITLARFSRP